MLTAHEFLNQEQYYSVTSGDIEEIKQAMIKFAKMHVIAITNAIHDNINLKVEGGWGTVEYPGIREIYTRNIIKNTTYGHGDSTYEIITVNEKIIWTVYPLDNIK